MARHRRPESQVQHAVFQHLAVRAATGTFVFHCPNGGWRSKVEAGIMKSLGVMPGVPDVIAIRKGEIFALELKAPGGRLSSAQTDCHGRLRAAGAKVATAVGIDEAVAVLEEWRILR